MGNLLRIVIADDHPIVRYGMRLALEANDIAQVIAEASSPYELFEILEQKMCDIVVTDFSMPGGRAQDGIAMIESLCESIRIYPSSSLRRSEIQPY